MNGPFEIHFEIASFLHLNSKICKVKYHAVLPTLVMKLQVENVCLFTYVTQGAGRPFDLPKKLPMFETRVFGFGTTWGTTFTKVILLRMAEAVLYF